MSDATFHGLHKWTAKMFEHFGYILLAAKNENYEKVSTYLDSLENLEFELENALYRYHDEDKLIDLEILLEKVQYLSNVAKHAFQ